MRRMRRWQMVLLGMAALVVVLAALAAWRLAGEAARSRAMVAEEAGAVAFVLADCAGLRRPETPNTWLAASDDACGSVADEPAAAFGVSVAAQADLWQAFLAGEPGVTIMAVSDDRLLWEVSAETSLMGFVDRISIALAPDGPDRSTAAIYSRSLVGHSDFGANRERVRAWVAEIERRAGAGR